MYPTIRPPRSPGHDSSAGGRLYSTIRPLRFPGHNRSVGE